MNAPLPIFLHVFIIGDISGWVEDEVWIKTTSIVVCYIKRREHQKRAYITVFWTKLRPTPEASQREFDAVPLKLVIFLWLVCWREYDVLQEPIGKFQNSLTLRTESIVGPQLLICYLNKKIEWYYVTCAIQSFCQRRCNSLLHKFFFFRLFIAPLVFFGFFSHVLIYNTFDRTPHLRKRLKITNGEFISLQQFP